MFTGTGIGTVAINFTGAGIAYSNTGSYNCTMTYMNTASGTAANTSHYEIFYSSGSQIVVATEEALGWRGMCIGN